MCSGGGAGRWPRLEGPRSRAGHPETCWRRVCPSGGLSGSRSPPPMIQEGEKVWLLELPRACSLAAAPPPLPASAGEAFPPWTGPMDQGQPRAPWRWAEPGALSAHRCLRRIPDSSLGAGGLAGWEPERFGLPQGDSLAPQEMALGLAEAVWGGGGFKAQSQTRRAGRPCRPQGAPGLT